MSAKAAWLLEDPRVPGWIENAQLHTVFGYAPTDPDERTFLLSMIDDE